MAIKLTTDAEENGKSGLILGAAKKISENDQMDEAPQDSGKYSLKKKKDSAANLSLQLIAQLVAIGDITVYNKNRIPSATQDDAERNIYDAIDGFIYQFKKMPTEAELIEYLETKQVFDVSFPAISADHTVEYIHAKVIEQRMDLKAMGHMKKFVEDRENKVPTALRINTLMRAMTKVQGMDTTAGYRSSEDLAKDVVLKAVENTFSKKNAGILLGWDPLDEVMMGITGGNILSIVGRPSQGKSWLALYAARSALRQGKNTLIVPMEMPQQDIMTRLIAMDCGVEYNKIAKKGVSTKELAKVKKAQQWYIDEAAKEDGVVLKIMDHNDIITPDSIKAECLKYGIEMVVVDAAYLVRHANPYYDRDPWIRLKEVAEELKRSIAANLNLPIICTYQFKREVDKYKDKNDLDLDDIYGGDVVGQISSVVVGIWVDSGSESLGKKHCKMLKGREGEAMINGFDINWDFEHMDFSAYKEEDLTSFTL